MTGQRSPCLEGHRVADGRHPQPLRRRRVPPALEIITPSGLEDMFARFGALGARGELTPETMGATAAEYGSTMFMDWVPELTERYGLTLMG